MSLRAFAVQLHQVNDLKEGDLMADEKAKQPEKPPTVDPSLSNPSPIEAPDRTGAPPSASTTTSQREPKFDLKPLDAVPPTDRAEKEVQRAVEQAMHEEYVQQEAQRRVASARAERLMASVNTQNPYNLKPGEKPVYQVGGFLVDPDGTRIKRISNAPVRAPEVIVDRATSMKQM
jgi:hypothetical protein